MTATYVLLGLAAVGVLVAAGLRWWWPHRMQQSDAIRLVTSRYLGGKRFLTLVEVDGERLLLGLAGEQVSLVARLGAGHPNAPEGRA